MLAIGQRLRQSVRQEQRLSVHVRQAIQNHLFALRVQLISAIRDEIYDPRAQCPKCGRHLNPAEILMGFTRNPRDLTTKCPSCKTRFEARIASVSAGGGTSVEMRFYCPIQTLHGLEVLCRRSPRHTTMPSPSWLMQNAPAVYHSALVHYGTLKAAFEKNGLEYPYLEVVGWEKAVMSFLGSLPDTTVAACAGVSTAIIRRIRRQKGIAAFRKRELAEGFA